MSKALSDIRIGISGWRGKFYPADLPQRRELEFASTNFNSIEINGSFYSLQLPSSYRRWYEATPPDFLFSINAGAGFNDTHACNPWHGIGSELLLSSAYEA